MNVNFEAEHAARDNDLRGSRGSLLICFKNMTSHALENNWNVQDSSQVLGSVDLTGSSLDVLAMAQPAAIHQHIIARIGLGER